MKNFDITEFMGEPVDPRFDPPGCPASRGGELIDISASPLYIYADDQLLYTEAQAAAWFVFGEDMGDGRIEDYVETGTVVLPNDTPAYELAVELQQHPEDPRIARVQQALVQRTKQCPGALADGECWALGPKAVEAILNDIISEEPEVDQPSE